MKILVFLYHGLKVTILNTGNCLDLIKITVDILPK